jgi:hypothetical protein
MIADNFYCRQGDEVDTRWIEQKLIDLLKSVPAGKRDGLRYIALKTLLLPNKPCNRGSSLLSPDESAHRLNGWMCQLASELVEKMEKLKIQ